MARGRARRRIPEPAPATEAPATEVPATEAAAAPLVRMALEAPAAGARIAVNHRLSGYGWACSAARIRAVTVDLDDERLCHAETALQRADLTELLAEAPEARPGFMFQTHVPDRPLGAARLRITVQTEQGDWTQDVPVDLVAEVPAEDVPELAAIEPLRLNLDEARRGVNGLLHVRGWSVGLRPLRSIELRLGDMLLGRATTGLPSGDVAEAYPEYPNAGHAGFARRMPVPRSAAGDLLTAIVTDGANETRSARLRIAADLPAAGFDGPRLRATIEEAHVDAEAVLSLRGWSVGMSPLRHVRVFLDGRLLGDAEPLQPREDVAVAFPDYPDSVDAGFVMRVQLDEESREARALRVVFTTVDETRLDVSAVLTQAPAIFWPPPASAALQCFCDAVTLTEDGWLLVKGWALCASGVAAIALMLDGAAVGTATLGGDRPDVGTAFPALRHARNAGFQFHGRVAETCAGDYALRLDIAGAQSERRVMLLAVTAAGRNAEVAAPAPISGIRCYLDAPAITDGRVGEPVRGFLSLSGWALSPAGIAGIEVFVDGRSQGQAHRGIRREDLYQALDDIQALRAGFAMLIPPQALKRGEHDIRVVIHDNDDATHEIAFVVDSQPGLHGDGPWALRRKLTQAEIDLQRAVLNAAGYQPHVVLLVRGGSAAALGATVASLQAQAWENWSLMIAGAALPAMAADDPRVRLLAAEEATPLAALLPTDGPALFGLLGAGDELGEDALLELALAGATDAAPDFLYADERRTDPGVGETRAFFKPDFSPDLLLSTNYIGRLWLVAAGVLARAGLRLGDLARHGEYDAVLRLTELAARIHHVPRVLAARVAPIDDAGTEMAALLRAVMRRGIDGSVAPGCVPGTWRLQRKTLPALVSIIIPTIASCGLVSTAIGSIRAHTAAERIEIVVLDNIRGDDDDSRAWKQWFRDNADTVVTIDESFNWSRFNNLGARAARGDMLLFLNDDIEVHDDGWLDGLLEHAQRAEVGAVGPQLLYPDGKVQHAGMFLSGPVGRHAFRFSPADEPGPFGLARTQRNVISVTGACLLTRRDIFEQLGGFDEQHSVINNDLDFCLRLRRAGKLVVYTPYVTLTHHEMVSRAELSDTFDTAHFRATWADLFATGDPYYSPSLVTDADDYVVEQEPARVLHVGPPLIARARVRRIVALKLDHIGDFISAFPAFRRIKQQFPNAELTVLGAAASAALAPLEPAIDRFIRFDFYHAVSELGRRTLTEDELSGLAEQLAPYRFDLAIDLRRQPDTRPVLKHTGARWLAGFDRGNEMRYLDITAEWEGDQARTHKHAHVSQALVGFVDVVAGACETERRLIVGGVDRDAHETAAALPALAGMAALFARPLVAVHAGAGAENKQWPPQNFAALIDLLVTEGGCNAVIIGSKDEAPIAEQVLAAVQHVERVGSVVGLLGLRELPVLLRGCALYVGNDSGPKHMAAALGVPTVGIHSGSVDVAEWGPMGEAAVAVRRDMSCSPCYLAHAADCHRALACLHGIRVGDVWRAIRPLLLLRSQAAARHDVAA